MERIRNKTMKIGLIAMLFISLLSTTVSTVKAATGGIGYTIEQTFPDANLATEVATKLGKSVDDEITQADINGAVSWNFTSKEISDISGIEYFTNLTYLGLSQNQISNLGPLSQLSKLTNLSLSDNQISNLNPLSQLSELTNLSLSDNQITDLSPLTGLTNLNTLVLPINKITDLSPLAGMTDVTYLDLYWNQISDLSPLAGMTDVTYLSLNKNQIRDLSPLAGMTKLTQLFLEENQISNLSPLAEMTDLTNLSLNNNQISDLSPLAGMTELTVLRLFSQEISLNSVSCGETLSIKNIVKNVDGSLLDPDSISNNGTYSNSYLSWDELDSDISQVSYTFDQNVTIGSKTVKFSGTVKQPITVTQPIVSKNISEVKVKPIAAVVYVGPNHPHTPKPVVTDGDYTLVENVDYTLSYENNVNAGTATTIITGIGNYEGTKQVTFTINRKALDVEVEPIADVVYTRTAHTPKLVVTDGNYTLVENVDYTLSYKNNVNAGTATIIITGIGNYEGTKQVNFTINRKGLDVVVSLEDIGYIAQNIPHTPKPVVTEGEYTLIENVDYTLSYENNVNAGTATIIITGIGNYEGTKQVTFIITDVKIEPTIDVVSKPNGTDEVKVDTKKSTRNLPKTGDSLETIMLMTALITSGLLCIGLKKKKRV